LLAFGFKVLHVAKDKDGKLTLVKKVKDNVMNIENVDLEDLTSEPSRSLRKKPTDESRAQAAEKKLTLDFDVSGAVRLLSSDDCIASVIPETIKEMQDKHPSAHSDDEIPPPPSPDLALPKCTPDSVRQAIRSFRPGASGGIDAMTPAHLRDLISVDLPLRWQILEGLAHVCDKIRNAEVPTELRDLLFGGWLIAIKKKAGGYRPIVVGSVFRRLATKTILRPITSRIGGLLRPQQLGVGTKNGAELIIHSVRTFLESHNRCVALKVDFKNAFNSHKRGEMLRILRDKVPELYPLMYEAYRSPTPLKFGEDSTLYSACGCQQGDVAAPVAFSLLLQPLLEKLTSSLSLAYLDDVTCCDTTVETVLQDVLNIKQFEALSGLTLNSSKCELFTKGFTTEEAAEIVQKFDRLLPGIQVVDEDCLQLLGAAVFEEAVDTALQEKAEQLGNLYDRLPLLSHHVALFLLQNALGIQKINYFLRTSPAFTCPTACEDLDSAQLLALEKCLNLSFSQDAATQLQLPISLGGLGVRSAATLALPCFLSSAYAAIDTVRDTLQNLEALPSGLEKALSKWEKGCSLPPLETRARQQTWDELSSKKVWKGLVDSNTADTDQARLNHLACKEAGYFLQAIPSPAVGTLLSNAHLRSAVGLRLGLPLYEEHKCACGAVVDSWGLHKLDCKVYALAKIARHDSVNDVLSRALRQAQVSNRVEPSGLSPDRNIRPDGLTVMPWSKGRALIWDVTIRNTYAVSYLPQSSRRVGSVAEHAEKEKRAHYRSLLNQYSFVPFVIETSGLWSGEALEFTKQIGARITEITGEERATSFLRQRISIEAIRGTATILLEGLNTGEDFEELFML